MTGAAPAMLDKLGEGRICLAGTAPMTADDLRISLKQRGAWGNIKPMPNRKNIRHSIHGSIASETASNASNKLKHFGAVRHTMRRTR